MLARLSGSGTAAWYLTDRQGSVRNIQSYAGTTALDTIAYDAYGNFASETNGAQGDAYKYDGYVYDAAIGLYYVRSRYYAAPLGRWIEQDPIGFSGGDVDWYRYAGNAPSDNTDPSGLSFKPATTSDLQSAIAAKGLLDGLTKGSLPYNRIVGRVVQDAALACYDLSENGINFPAPARAKATNGRYVTVRPDAVDNLTIEDTTYDYFQGPIHTETVIPGGVWFEVKAVSGTISLSYENYQILGLVEGATRTVPRKCGYPAILCFITAADTTIGSDVINEASKRGLLLYQVIMKIDPSKKTDNFTLMSHPKLLNFAAMKAKYPRLKWEIHRKPKIVTFPLPRDYDYSGEGGDF